MDLLRANLHARKTEYIIMPDCFFFFFFFFFFWGGGGTAGHK